MLFPDTSSYDNKYLLNEQVNEKWQMETYSTSNMHLNSFPKRQVALESFLNLINDQK